MTSWYPTARRFNLHVFILIPVLRFCIVREMRRGKALEKLVLTIVVVNG